MANKLFDPIAAEIAAAAGAQGKAAAKDAGPKRKTTAEPKADKAAIKLPKTAAAVADLFYRTQQERYALQRQGKALEDIEAACREFLIENLPKSEASGVSGKVARSYVENKDIIQVQDWTELYKYVQSRAAKNPGIWGIFQKRITSEMAEELMADPKESKALAKALKKGQVPVVRLNKL
jgi:hypothetical protein